MSKRVLIPIAEGTEELEAVTLIDTLRRAGAEVTVASVSPALEVAASRGVRLIADKRIGECTGEAYDLVVLPGGMPGAKHLRDSVELKGILERQQQAGRLIGAICAAPAVVLQRHGLIGGRKATAYPAYLRDLKNPDPARVVVDAGLATSQGPGTALEFALALVELLFGAAQRQALAKEMIAG